MSRRDLEVNRRLVIPAAELRESASRSGGPGGQHVNKTSTRVTLRWCATRSAALSDTQRARLLRRLGARLTRGGDLVVETTSARPSGSVVTVGYQRGSTISGSPPAKFFQMPHSPVKGSLMK